MNKQKRIDRLFSRLPYGISITLGAAGAIAFPDTAIGIVIGGILFPILGYVFDGMDG